jgi:hypothetical protein
MNSFFWDCVKFMQVTAKWLGLTYEEWNVILFVIIHPLITIALLYGFIYYCKKYRGSKKTI